MKADKSRVFMIVILKFFLSLHPELFVVSVQMLTYWSSTQLFDLQSWVATIKFRVLATWLVLSNLCFCKQILIGLLSMRRLNVDILNYKIKHQDMRKIFFIFAMLLMSVVSVWAEEKFETVTMTGKNSYSVLSFYLKRTMSSSPDLPRVTTVSSSGLRIWPSAKLASIAGFL